MTSTHLFGHSPFTADLAAQHGICRSRLQRAVADGLVRQIFQTVYVSVAAPDDIGLRARAAALILPDHVVVSDRSAAWLHGIDLLDYAELDIVPNLEVVSTNGKEGTERQGILGGKRALRPEDVMTVGGVRVTTPIRTTCDVARLRGRLQAIACLDAFRRAHGIGERELVAMLPGFAGERGVIQLRELIALSTPAADSQAESWVRLMIHDEGLPMPQAQVEVLLPDFGRVRIENAYAHLRVGVEYDGEENHTSDADREHDRGRRAALRAAGWIIIVIRKDDLADGVRRWWLAELAEALSARAPEARIKQIYSRGPDRQVRRRPRRR